MPGFSMSICLILLRKRFLCGAFPVFLGTAINIEVDFCVMFFSLSTRSWSSFVRLTGLHWKSFLTMDLCLMDVETGAGKLYFTRWKRARSSLTVSCWRPFCLRLLSTSLPFFVEFLLRKPWVRFLLIFDGWKVRFITQKGNHLQLVNQNADTFWSN